jgi:hypothetical protein
LTSLKLSAEIKTKTKKRGHFLSEKKKTKTGGDGGMPGTEPIKIDRQGRAFLITTCVEKSSPKALTRGQDQWARPH